MADSGSSLGCTVLEEVASMFDEQEMSSSSSSGDEVRSV